MATKLRFLFVICLLAAGVTAAQDARYVFDRRVDFSKFKTYRWADLSSEGSTQDRLAEQLLKQAVDHELAAKGLRETDSVSAELRIQLRSTNETQKKFYDFDTGSYGGLPIGPLRQGGWWSTVGTRVIALRLVSSADGAPVWTGLVSNQTAPDAKPPKQAKSIGKSVKKLLKNYPPRQQ
jgi:hypothetical protein